MVEVSQVMPVSIWVFEQVLVDLQSIGGPGYLSQPTYTNIEREPDYLCCATQSNRLVGQRCRDPTCVHISLEPHTSR